MSKETDEFVDDDFLHGGGEEHYDGVAVDTIPYDHSQFELPEDFEASSDDEEGSEEDD